MFKRSISLPENQSFFLFGPRQTGKTTLLRQIFSPEKTIFYNLLDSEEYMRLAARPVLFREEVLSRSSRISHVVVDEVQRIPGLLNEVQYLLDHPSAPHFILSGSSARKLKRAGANLLGGRAWLRYLHPLTQNEMGSAFRLAHALRWGTLPPVANSAEVDAREVLNSYVQVYIKEEIEAGALIRNTGPFLRFLTQAAHTNGELINYSNIAREAGISHVTVKEYYRILEDTMIGRLLLPWHKSTRKRLSAQPRFYFFDTGVARALQKKLPAPLAPGTPEYGRLFETWMVNETIRVSDYGGLDLELSHYRTNAGAEVDLIIETPRGKTWAVEFKSSIDPGPPDCRSGFESFRELVPQATCVCVADIPRSRTVQGIHFWPWAEYLEQLVRTET